MATGKRAIELMQDYNKSRMDQNRTDDWGNRGRRDKRRGRLNCTEVSDWTASWTFHTPVIILGTV